MSPKDSKLIKKFQNSCKSARYNEIVRLCESYGFLIQHGKKHDKITHPDYADLYSTLPRHTKIAEYICKQILKLIERLKSLQEEKHEKEIT